MSGGELGWLGRILIGMGIIAIIAGVLLLGFSRLPHLGRLPGDIFYQRGNFTLYFPLVTSVILSLVLTLILNLLFRR